MMKDFKISPDDARLTAYALGELQGSDRAEFEAALEKDPEARALVEQTQKLAQELTAALASEPEPAAGDALLREVMRNEEDSPESRVAEMPQYEGGRSKVLRCPQLYYIIGGLAAACFAVLIALHDQKPAVTTHYVEIDLNPGRDHNVATAATESAPITAPAATDPGTSGVPPHGTDRTATDRASEATIAAVRPAPGEASPERLEVSRPKSSPAAAPESLASSPAVPEPVPVEAAPPRNPGTSAKVAASTPAVGTGGAAAAQVPAGSGQPPGAPALGATARTSPDAAVATSSTAPDKGGGEVVQLMPFEVSDRHGGREVARSRPRTPPPSAAGAGVPAGSGASEPAPAAAAYDGGEFVSAARNRLSWFSPPPDTGNYEQIRRSIEAGRLPPADTVEIEELINHFRYREPLPPKAMGGGRSGTALFAASLEVAGAPWAPEHRLVRIGLRVTDPAALAGARIAPGGKLSAQVEFNPARVESYRLIGYEKRKDAPERFADEAPFADVHAGQSITALYEIVPGPGYIDTVAVDDANASGYGPVHHLGYNPDYRNTADLLTVRVRFQEPGGGEKRADIPLTDRGMKFADASHDFKFAAAVAEFAMILRDSPHRGKATMRDVLAWAREGTSDRGDDPGGFRAEFLDLARRTQALLQ
jgi:hypothetical protein